MLHEIIGSSYFVAWNETKKVHNNNTTCDRHIPRVSGI
jgi:hypothetical protein